MFHNTIMDVFVRHSRQWSFRRIIASNLFSCVRQSSGCLKYLTLNITSLPMPQDLVQRKLGNANRAVRITGVLVEKCLFDTSVSSGQRPRVVVMDQKQLAAGDDNNISS